MDIIYAISGSV